MSARDKQTESDPCYPDTGIYYHASSFLMDDSDSFQNYDRGNLCQPVRNSPVYMEMGQF